MFVYLRLKLFTASNLNEFLESCDAVRKAFVYDRISIDEYAHLRLCETKMYRFISRMGLFH